MYKKRKYFQILAVLLQMIVSSAFGGDEDDKNRASTVSPKTIRVKTRSNNGHNRTQSSPTLGLIQHQKKQVEKEIRKSGEEKGRQKREELLLKRHNHEGFSPLSHSSSATTFSSSSPLGFIPEEVEEENQNVVTSPLQETKEMSNTNQPPLNIITLQQPTVEEEKKLF